ncbi:hypothetical protein D3P96_00655 [Weissella viridescens]|uniref:Uncharacterized protein n=1 Tax=Weissella viridescens TaxID=1629 RepID=A0A3P2RM30_WEIVI|nr:hypothetical protein [Weissella viridescens]RRG18528.1 hypothetical protein D3P96_00655 [Weissella viridescens]
MVKYATINAKRHVEVEVPMKTNPYIRFSIYASLISLLLLLQNSQHLFQLNLLITLITIWACLLFFAYFEAQHMKQQQHITNALRRQPELIPIILARTSLTKADINALMQPQRSYRSSTLTQIQKIITQYQEN